MDEALNLQFLFQTLGDANRLRIIRCIGDKECAVSEIVSATGLSQPLVSHHLRVLRERQVLTTNRKGPFVYYAVNDPKLLDALGIFLQLALKMDDQRMEHPMFCCPPWWNRFKNK